jgi:uncharacterized protein (TIGR03083 family)
MQLTPRYDGPTVLRFDGPIGDPSIALVRQRRRLGEVLAGLDAAQWATPSRCDGWTVRDVVAHLGGTNQFWARAATAALAGEPTRFLAAFDPVATPAAMVGATADVPASTVLSQYAEGVEQLAGTLTGLDDEQWSRPAEAPPGHIALHAMARHALWDAWIHERDVLVPLGMAQPEEPDELRACLEYAAAIGPALLASTGSTRTATLAVDASDPDLHVVVELAASVRVHDGAVHDGDVPDGVVRLTGSTVDLIEGLSFRAPLPHDVADDDRWVLGGLAAAFDVVAGA